MKELLSHNGEMISLHKKIFNRNSELARLSDDTVTQHEDWVDQNNKIIS